MLHRHSTLWILALLVIFTPCLCSYGQDASETYFDNIGSITEEFERIQAGMEVAFDPSLYIGSMQNLNFEHKRFTESYRNRKERKYLSYALEGSIVETYLSLVARIKSVEDVGQDQVNQVIDAVQQKVLMLKTAVDVEIQKGAKSAWVSLITSLRQAGDYSTAKVYVDLARGVYGDEGEILALEKEISGVIKKFDDDTSRAEKLMGEKKYSEALSVLEFLVVAKSDDTEIARMYETASSYVKKIDDLTGIAHEHEDKGRLKEAYRTWEELLEYDPASEEGLSKIKKYREQLKLGTTEIVTTCENCSGHGYCNVCKGAGLCLDCSGYRKCVKCRGLGYFSRRCPYCVCRSCRGTGLCSTCEGRRTVICTSCGGLGYHRTAQQAPCNVCGGSGKSRFNNRPCPVCGGTGKTSVNVDKLCSVCKGAKVLQCPTCSADGRCVTCGGRGHTAGCSHCNGKGQIVRDCKFCGRTGVCPECSGTGVCKYCKGSGKCSECNGAGAIVKKIDEEKYLSEKNHFISVVTSPRGAQVYLDGKLRGITPLEIEDVAAGEHLIRISKPGFDDFNYGMIFTESYTAQLDIKLTSSRFEAYRVVGIAKTRHSMLFTNYQEQENDSFMISLYVDGRNEWKELGETVLGHKIDSLKREFKSKYNPRLKESQVVDLSSLILTKADGTEVGLLRNNSMQFVVYRAKVYDNTSRRFVYVEEGSKLGDAVVQNITDNEIVLRDKSGNSFTLSKQ